MKEFINPPTDYCFTVEDIILDYERIQDKKAVAKIYLLSVKEVTRILKEVHDERS